MAEMDVFYDLDDFAVSCTRSRPGEDDVQFAALLATAEEDVFDGRVALGTHLLRYPSAAVQLERDDVLLIVRKDDDGEPLPDETWRVIGAPRRVIDGSESEVHLTLEDS